MPSKAIMLSSKPEDKSFSLSVSKLKTFKDCKAKYRFSYIEKLPKKDWAHLSFGKFLHEILENFHKELIDLCLDSYEVIMSRCFKKALDNWRAKISKDNLALAKQMIVKYVSLLQEQKAAGTLPTFLAVEKDFFINIDDTVLLNGFIDRIQLDQDGILHVADYKTTQNKKYLKNDFLQLLTYAYVLCLEDPSLQKVRGSYILLRHDFEMVTKEFLREEIMAIEDQFVKYTQLIMEEKLWRPNPTPLCSFCDFTSSCPEGNAVVVKKNGFGASTW